MTKNLTQRTLSGLAWSGGASVLRIVLRLISVAILARLLSPADYGIMAGALIIIALAETIYNLGLVPTLIQRKEIEPEHIATGLGATLLLSLVAGAALWFAAPTLAALMHIEALSEITRWLALFTPLGAFVMICEALLAREMRMREIALRPLFSFTLSSFLVAVPLAYCGYGYWALVASQVAETVISALLLGYAARKLLAIPRFSPRAFRELWPMSLGFSLNQPLAFLATNADKLLISRLMDADSLGLYTRASFITNTSTNLFANIARATVFPAMARVQDDHDRLRSGLSKSLSLIALVTFPATAFYMQFAKEIIDFLLGSRWEAAITPFAIMSAMLYVQFAHKVAGTMLQALGRPYSLMLVQTAAVVIMVGAASMVGRYGLTAICAAIVLARTATAALTLTLACKAIKLRIVALWKPHAIPFLVTAVIATIGHLLRTIFFDTPVLAMAGTGFVALLVLAVALLFTDQNTRQSGTGDIRAWVGKKMLASRENPQGRSP
jgi:O-antigen/teichoic acid export membrane protein